MSLDSESVTRRPGADQSSPLRVLVVEDEPADARLMLAALRDQLPDCEPFVVPTCRDAIAFLERDRDPRVDVVLLDVRLPDGNGLDVLQLLHDEGRLQHTHVVVFTGAPDGKQVTRAYELGASFYLVKPIDFDEYDRVVEAITRCLAAEQTAAPDTEIGLDPRPTILLVEDSASDARHVRELLRHDWAAGLAVRHVERLADAREAVTDNVWAIVLDLSLPDAHDMMAITELRAVAPFTSIVVLTGLDDTSAGMRALERGAQDYLQKDSLTSDMLVRSVQFAIQRTRAVAAVTRLATHDPLTDLPNRTLLLDRLQLALARAKRLGTHVAVLFIDIDDLKAINDQHGHAAGDAVLKEAARRMRAAVRPSDTVCRLAGDEFVVLYDDAPDEQTAIGLSERVGQAVAGRFDFEGKPIEISASIGVVMANETLHEATSLLRAADAAMYDAKRARKTDRTRGDA